MTALHVACAVVFVLQCSARSSAGSHPQSVILRSEGVVPVVQTSSHQREFPMRTVAASQLEPELLRNEDPQVRVDVFYEVMCPYSRKFMSALEGVWNNPSVRSRIALKLYPYGNSRSIAAKDVSLGYKYWHPEFTQPGMDYIYDCQHGDKECFGNMIQACVIEHYRSPEQHVPFIICMMSKGNISLEWSSYECANSHSINLDAIRTCVTTSEGNKLMHDLALLTEALRRPTAPSKKVYVPFVVLDGEHSEDAEVDADPGNSGHFLHELCRLMKAPKPYACSDITVVDTPQEETDSTCNCKNVATKNSARRRAVSFGMFFAAVVFCQTSILRLGLV